MSDEVKMQQNPKNPKGILRLLRSITAIIFFFSTWNYLMEPPPIPWKCKLWGFNLDMNPP